MRYDYKSIEQKWQKYWDEHESFKVELDTSKPKFYALVEFPYPSGQGLHVGHPRSYTALASLMSLINDITNTNAITKQELKIFITLLCPLRSPSL